MTNLDKQIKNEFKNNVEIEYNDNGAVYSHYRIYKRFEIIKWKTTYNNGFFELKENGTQIKLSKSLDVIIKLIKVEKSLWDKISNDDYFIDYVHNFCSIPNFNDWINIATNDFGSSEASELIGLYNDWDKK